MLKSFFLWICTNLGLWKFPLNSFIFTISQHFLHFLSRTLSSWSFIAAFTRTWLKRCRCRFYWIGVTEEILDVELTKAIASSPKSYSSPSSTSLFSLEALSIGSISSCKGLFKLSTISKPAWIDCVAGDPLYLSRQRS